MSGWDSKWGISKELEKSIDDTFDAAFDKAQALDNIKPETYFDINNWPKTVSWSTQPNSITWDKGTDNKAVIVKVADGKVAYIGELKSQGSNLVDDQAYLYFQCEGCNEILDPHTKSFKTLQDKRVEAGWKCIWNIDGMGYKVYCEKCEEKI